VPLLHARADAVDVLQFEAEQDIGQVVLGEPVVTGNFNSGAGSYST
jgi:hypothetical protein